MGFSPRAGTARLYLAGPTCAIALLGAGLASAAEPSFPKSLDKSDLSTWLRAATDLQPQQIAVAGPLNAIAIVRNDVGASRQLRTLTVHLEALDRKVAQEVGYSFQAEVGVDCEKRAYSSAVARAFSGRRRQGHGRVIKGDGSWVRPVSGEDLYLVVQAACDPAYVWPLRQRSQPGSKASGGEALQGGTGLASVTNVRKAVVQATSSTPGGAAIQVAAARSREAAEAEAASAKALLTGAPRLTIHVLMAGHRSAPFFRSQLHGFAASADARAACEQLATVGRDCFVIMTKGSSAASKPHVQR